MASRVDRGAALRALFAIGLVIGIFMAGMGAAEAKKPPVDKATAAAAQEHYEAGRRAYNVADFDLAISEWKAGYQLQGSPDFLFNLAQCYRKKREYGQAIFFFDAFLREKPDAANRAEVESLSAEMQKLLEQQSSAQELPPKETMPPGNTPTTDQPGAQTPPPVESPPVGETPPAPEAAPTSGPRPGRGLKIAGIVTGSAGVLLVGLGAFLSMSASGTASDLEAAAARGEPWSADFADSESSARSKSTLGLVSIVTGAAAIAGGVTLYLLGARRSRVDTAPAARLELIPNVDRKAASLAVRMGF